MCSGYVTLNSCVCRNRPAASTDLVPFHTSTDLVPFRTSTDLVPFHTSTDLVPFRTSTDLASFHTSTDLVPFHTSTDLVPFHTSTDLVPFHTSTDLVPFRQTRSPSLALQQRTGPAGVPLAPSASPGREAQTLNHRRQQPSCHGTSNLVSMAAAT